jgi:hypothetical protein
MRPSVELWDLAVREMQVLKPVLALKGKYL